MQLRTLTRLGSVVAVFCCLVGCFTGNASSAYARLMDIPEDEQRCAYFQALPSSERINLYLEGVNEIRPSDYSLGDCFGDIDPQLAGELIERLKRAPDQRNAFGLVLVLHGVTKTSYPYVVPPRFKVQAYCKGDAPCLQLAKQIDKRFSTHSRDGSS